MEKQSTINTSVSISGKGLHSGKQVTVNFIPAAEDCGIKFQRVDLPEKPIIHANVFNVYDTSRGTSIREYNAEVKTVEHLLAALAGLKIDNLLIEIDAEEMPIMDGSAKLFVEALLKSGVKNQNKTREHLIIDKIIKFEKPDKGIELTITPADSFKMTVEVDYGTDVLAKQHASLNSMDEFLKEIYNCRTFVFLHEIQFLIQHNLALGGDLDNAIVFVDKKPDAQTLEQLAKFFNKSNIRVMENGILNNLQLHHPNEPARHKLLDLVGDLYLLGKPIQGHIVAKKTGHFANVEFAKLIAEAI